MSETNGGFATEYEQQLKQENEQLKKAIYLLSGKSSNMTREEAEQAFKITTKVMEELESEESNQDYLQEMASKHEDY